MKEIQIDLIKEENYLRYCVIDEIVYDTIVKFQKWLKSKDNDYVVLSALIDIEITIVSVINKDKKMFVRNKEIVMSEKEVEISGEIITIEEIINKWQNQNLNA